MYPARPGIVIGFHGCDKSLRDKVVRGTSMLFASQNDYDWLGHGMYFWENNNKRAIQFAEDIKVRPRTAKSAIKSPAVLGAVIDLGFCLDLPDSEYLELVQKSYNTLKASYKLLDLELPTNKSVGNSRDLLLRKLDCAVIENLHLNAARSNLRIFDSVRGVFVEGDPLYPNAGFNSKNHIQICIRNPNCIKGFFIPRTQNNSWEIP